MADCGSDGDTVITYKQSTGEIFADGSLIGTAYAGHPPNVNNPDAQDQKMSGPLPQGVYEIGAPMDKPESVGHFALPLLPDPSNEMYGRGSFYVHGDNPAGNQTASDGCIVTAPAIRQIVATHRQLTVIA